uniref:WAT1-related protein n=1 Tax=Saccharum spontaneum TaxID=62335 RepID=A0A678THW3_SACSP|nr:WAT1-related protein [Saccharum spontaneum]
MVNTVPSITFVILIILRMEIVDAKSLRGMVKIARTVVSLAGATTMTLYKGEAITSHWKTPIHIPGSGVVCHSWWRGPILALASCLCWSIWFILQASSIKRYPTHSVFAVLMQHKHQDWMIGFLGLKFWCVIYSGIVCSGFTFYVQLWCTQKKGPVTTKWHPLLQLGPCRSMVSRRIPGQFDRATAWLAEGYATLGISVASYAFL